MSKYYKADDVINAIENKIAEYIPTLYGRYAEIPLELRMAIEHLPTIEVSEDCISREWVYNELNNVTAVTPTQIDMLSDFADIIKNAPSVVPCCNNEKSNKVQQELQQAEDCISREWVKGICENMLDEEMLGHMLGYIEDAPSVVPSRAEGEWKRHPIHENRAWDICTACGTGCRRRHYGFNEDGTEWVEQANYPFCPNCGAKMKV